MVRYMFRSYDHLQVEIYTSEINMMYIFPPEDGRTTEESSG
jgi:hypothetical protein